MVLLSHWFHSTCENQINLLCSERETEIAQNILLAEPIIFDYGQHIEHSTEVFIFYYIISMTDTTLAPPRGELISCIFLMEKIPSLH